LGSGSITSPRLGSLRGTHHRSKHWSPNESPRGVAIANAAGGRKLNSSLEVNLGRSILNNQSNIRNAGLEIEQKYLGNKLQTIEYREIGK
jgi:hypothetical protein